MPIAQGGNVSAGNLQAAIPSRAFPITRREKARAETRAC